MSKYRTQSDVITEIQKTFSVKKQDNYYIIDDLVKVRPISIKRFEKNLEHAFNCCSECESEVNFNILNYIQSKLNPNQIGNILLLLFTNNKFYTKPIKLFTEDRLDLINFKYNISLLEYLTIALKCKF